MDKKTNLCQLVWQRVGVWALLTSALFSTTNLSAQCNLSCHDLVYMSVDTMCQVDVTVADVLKDTSGCVDGFVEVFDEYGANLGTVVDGKYRGRKLTFKVHSSPERINNCWGYLIVEDKLGPVIECRDDTVNCWEAEELLDPDIVDNCGYMTLYEQSSLQWVDYECENDNFVGYIERDVITQDIWGNTNRCTGQRLYILREVLDSLVCPEEQVEIECCTQKMFEGVMVDVLWHPKYTYEDEDGYTHPIPGEGMLVEGPYLNDRGGRHYLVPNQTNRGKCNILTEYKDHIIPTCGSSYKIRREWLIFDWCTGEDTVCTQWIKITDTLAPEIEGNNVKEICLEDPSNLWDGFDNICTETVTATDITPQEEDCYTPRVFYTKPHDCKAHVVIQRPNIINECGIKFAKGDEDKIAAELSKVQVTYELQYIDYTHPAQTVTLAGDVPHGEDVIIYLPAGWYQVLYIVKDECWNETYACERFLVIDNVAPTPVCDEITQVTLDPESCWTRIPAKDLDDGSNDNCAQNLHFAVASMDSIEKYTDYWTRQLEECVDPYIYEAHGYYFDQLIDHWINCFVFNEYYDASECGEETLVLRVYEADGLPVYDPHTFKGNRHQWFCFNLYDDYACFFKYHYDEFANHLSPKADLCEYRFDFIEPTICHGNDGHEELRAISDLVESPYCSCNDDLPNCECEPRLMLDNSVPLLSESENGSMGRGLGEYEGVHGPEPNRACCVFENSTEDVTRMKWEALTARYPELVVLDCKRYKFKHLYNDCMIQILKDDKTPPVCIPPADVTAYCDGVPAIGSITIGNDKISWFSAAFAHDLCDESDEIDADCYLDKTTDDAREVTAPDEFCFAAPWDGGSYGYYGGPVETQYIYPGTDFCGDELPWYQENNWKPIYCRVWLLLDTFDITSSGKPNVESYFGEPTVEENCWTYTDTVITDGSLDECGAGSIVRTWTITDKCGNTTECSQRVTFRPRSDFEVKFPEDLVVNCDEDFRFEPVKGSDLYPVITDDECELIGVNYDDQILDVGTDGCYKILRTWKIIDWCLYNPDLQVRYPDIIVDNRCLAGEDRPCVVRNLKDDGDGFMTYLQVIKIIDTENPVVTCVPDDTICSFDNDCGVVFVDKLLGTAEDNCTPEDELEYRYTIIPDFATDERDYIFGHGNEVKRPLPVGTHQIILYAEDNCNNIDSCTTTLYLKDCKPPTPYCYDGIVTVLMADSGQVAVWAKDLDAGSFDNCTDTSNLVFSFDREGMETARTFTCDDVGENRVEMNVTDEDGNVDFCIVTLVIQEGAGNPCGGSPLANDQMDRADAGDKKTKDKDVGGVDIIRATDGVYDELAEGTIVLHQNRPNPFQTETMISFTIDQRRQINLSVYDVSGRKLWQQSGIYEKGYYQYTIDKQLLKSSAGVLYYQLESADIVLTKKMIMIR